jgi:hypothetical protein
MGELHPSDTLDNLRKAFPAGPRIGAGLALPADSYTGKRIIVRIKAPGTVGYVQPWSLTRMTIGGRRFYEAEWLDTRNRALFLRKRDADTFIDLHRYAEGVRRITGELPAWATSA